MAEAYLRNNQTRIQGRPIRLSPEAEMVSRHLGFRHPDGRPFTAADNIAKDIEGINASPGTGKSPFGGSQYGFTIPTDGDGW